MNKSLFEFKGIRRKIFAHLLITTLIMGITSIYSYYNAKIVIDRLKSIFTDYVYLNNLNNDINSLETEVEKYLSTKSSDSLLNYYTISNKLSNNAEDMINIITYDNDSLMQKDIGNMIMSLLSETDKAVNAKRGRISSEYIEYFTRANKINDYIKMYINNLIYNKLQEGSIKYNKISKNMIFISFLNILLILTSVIVNIVLAIIYTYRITRPISELSDTAERISKGDFDIEPIRIKTDDEVNILADAFNKMVTNIKNYIDEIKMQAKVEKRLKEQEMQNLKMKNILRESELKALQSQINPHFLFNTLNAASQIAMMEGAEKSSEFIEKVAELFRYNLRKLDKPVTLKEEVDNVFNYMYILKTRFGEKVEFQTSIDESLLNVKVPCTIIQPVVENAFIHGIEEIEGKGVIRIEIKEVDGSIHIDVIDDGMGMNQESINKILSADDPDNDENKHVTGIGMHNVINRLRLYYNIADIDDVIEIESRIGNGTKVTLKIPMGRGSAT
ncbi:sensor histidine kinase [Thermoanaerobacterium thermosaccharolyticum]|uniref:histidine kinase n=2 Tax=Thermoanaerobacterium thermosaccharolyticum TaxID=1517 RepID=D9TSB7_THETC|nr:sensor histidine kinase [Thermoanaerobacterium thermosaccharolyticum]ADL69840.1 integral membrane sensor signal transduction histidine kinase [Thermoanaerobacterium thermosaccharolyticum DSM 571]AGB19998.1 putative signal transduction protein with a C-terminal ATPase domain [Thermoanaerobacterium thermosaccharolyticum M0795]